jgi:hypothetical protein
VHALVRDYLAVRGYAETLARFDAAVGGGGGQAAGMETDDGGGGGGGGGETEQEEEQQQRAHVLPALVRKRRRAAGGDEGLRARVAMRRLVLAEGGEEAALARLAKEHPAVVGQGALVGFELRCLAFVARVRQGRAEEALAYARRELAPYAVPQLQPAAGSEEDGMDVCHANGVNGATTAAAAGGEEGGLVLASRLREVMGLLAYPGKEGCHVCTALRG